MKLAKLDCSGRTAWVAVDERGAVDLTPLLGTDPRAIRDHLLPEGLAKIREFAVGATPDLGPDDLAYLPCLPEPRKIVCVGVNYHNRNEEYRDGSALPEFPSLFFRSPTSFAAHGQPLVRPAESEQLDYEGELALVIGTGGRRIPREQALGHIAGLTLMNEGTVRDWVRHAKFNVTQGKNFDSSGAIGPWLVTADEFDGFELPRNSDPGQWRAAPGRQHRQPDLPVRRADRLHLLVHDAGTGRRDFDWHPDRRGRKTRPADLFEAGGHGRSVIAVDRYAEQRDCGWLTRATAGPPPRRRPCARSTSRCRWRCCARVKR